MLHKLLQASSSPLFSMNLRHNFTTTITTSSLSWSSVSASVLNPRIFKSVLLLSSQTNDCCSRNYHHYFYHKQRCFYGSIIPKVNFRNNLVSTDLKGQIGQLRLASVYAPQYLNRDSVLRNTCASLGVYSYYATNSASSNNNNSNNNSTNSNNNHQKSPSHILKANLAATARKLNLDRPTGNSRSVVTSPKIIEMEVQLQQALLEDPKLLTKEERNDFNTTFTQLVQDLTQGSEMRDMAETNRWLARVLQYNVPHGKKNRGLATALAYKFMAKDLTEENMQLSYVLGWCVEMLQAFFLVSDDIMDHSETRRGHPCWYKVDSLGPAAFNDAILLESSIYVLLSKYFRTKEYYVDLLEIFHDATNKTVFGQSLDTRTGLQRRMEGYTMELYSAIVKYKTSHYSFTLPVALAMAMAGMNEPELIRQAKTVTLEMGHFFQIQDDFLDCFGDEDVTGKIGTDIQDCKCSWLFVQALQRADQDQREFLLNNYGESEPSKVEKVKKMYLEMDLPQLYRNYEEQSYNTISSHILQMSSELPKSLFMDMLHKIYKRSS